MPSKPVLSPPSKIEFFVIRYMVFLGCVSIACFLFWFFHEAFRNDTFLYWLLGSTLIYAILKILYIWYHYVKMSIPPRPDGKPSLTVDILTTYFPGEPYEMIEETLVAIQKITYPHTTYLCDEANDPYLIALCRQLGVIHVTRDNRIDAKAGNINNALKVAKGEICVILDPDHVPEPYFLDPIIPHFGDPEIGFVQIVQSYYNVRETLVARGAAEQTFQFYGPMMMSMNSYGTVNAIGANCTFRRKALDSIGGHAPGLSEDMHTAMLLHARGWKSVYVPEVLAKGLAPSDLTSFFKQQLKWSRGTFDLLFYVYPKLFKNFTWRQRLHYGMLPLHYLIGTIYLINFLIPILSLCMARSPWTGNILFFGIFALPLATSSLLVRAFIQKWVIEKSERGFHLMGGLLQINTWWVYFLGFAYTIFRKKVPYLPTPKNGAEHSNFKIILPNLGMGLLSVFAIVYGLLKNFTPFSIVMASFALLNALFMFFGLYLATRRTNKNDFLRKNLNEETVAQLVRIKSWYRKLSDFVFYSIRPVAPVLLTLVVAASFFLQYLYQQSKWEEIPLKRPPKRSIQYAGIYYPDTVAGISDLGRVAELEENHQIHFGLVSLYLPWGDTAGSPIPLKEIDAIYKEERLPLITWEPWASTFKLSDSITLLRQEKKVFSHIASGIFDPYIIEVATALKAFDKPVFLRFGHEFDNPFYPWSPAGENEAVEFIEAWRHVHELFKEEGAHKVVWVWNPWKANVMQKYYPGDAYVDWVGITALNYGRYNEDGKWLEFDSIYRPFHEELKNLTGKPVMLTEFGSVREGGDQNSWIEQALESVIEKHPQIEAVVFFNNPSDRNLPPSIPASEKALDWTLNTPPRIPENFNQELPGYFFTKDPPGLANKLPLVNPGHRQLESFVGVKYKKGQNWTKNQYVASRNVLLKDFRLMKELGINRIQFTGGNIYDRNILKFARETDISLIYSFWIPHTFDFINDQIGKESLKNNILKTVEKLKDENGIVSWNLGNDTWANLDYSYNEPNLNYQRKAFLIWLKDLAGAIKQLDPERPLSVEAAYGPSTENKFSSFSDWQLPVDAYALKIDSQEGLDYLLEHPPITNSASYIGDLPVALYAHWKQAVKGAAPVILGNWQDQWESDLISFDGILDFAGSKTEAFSSILQFAGVSRDIPIPRKPRILRPALLLYEGQQAEYHVLFQEDDRWQLPAQTTDPESLQWYMIKNDQFGNHLAIKALGSGISKLVDIPPKPHEFEIMVRNVVDGRVSSDRTPLKTPLLIKDSLAIGKSL